MFLCLLIVLNDKIESYFGVLNRVSKLTYLSKINNNYLMSETMNEMFEVIEGTIILNGEEIKEMNVRNVENEFFNQKLEYEIMTMNLLSMVEVLYEKSADIPLSQRDLIDTITRLKQQKDIMITNQFMNEVYENKKKYIISKTNNNNEKCLNLSHFPKKRNVKEEDKKWECDNCGCRFINKKNLKRHKQTKKCSHIYVERIYTNATEKVSEYQEENCIKNKNNVLKNYERLFIKKIVGCMKKKQKEIANYWNTKEGVWEKFIFQLNHIYKKKYQKFINGMPKKKKIVFRLNKK